jgi:hypothetical protein
MKVKINLDTNTAAIRLVELAETLNENVYLTDGANLRVTAISLLFALCVRFDFNEIWLETENDHYFLFKDFIVED